MDMCVSRRGRGIAIAALSSSLAILLPSIARAAEDAAQRPVWIWGDAVREPSRVLHFRCTFAATVGAAARAELAAVADFARLELSLNDERVGETDDYGAAVVIDVSRHVRPGRNVIALRAVGSAGPSAVAVTLTVTSRDQSRQFILSDDTWEASPSADGEWRGVVTFGTIGAVRWGGAEPAMSVQPVDDYHQWKRALGDAAATDPATFQTQPGFRVELLRAAQPGEGSWVSLAFDPQGRLAIGKESKGILRLTLPAAGGGPIRVETINDSLKECRGLLYAHGALYANANESKGLYRLRDTDGDDRFDEVELLYGSGGGTGHGRNDLTLGPDGLVYSIHGDAVDLPSVGTPDRTSPFREHRRGRKTREGHVIRVDRDGNHLEIVTSGLRNPYGIDFNADGEMFTYDADAEYDMGTPWYRPTRVHHLLPGGDYGWRGVTGTWPPYYPDQPDATPPNVDIGKGSPTSVKFGYRSRFPPRVRRALFVLDWAYGRIVAVHWTPHGASYAGRPEVFLQGRPLNVTDIAFGPDGAMYVVTGGRKTRSALYRVYYAGPPVADAVPTPQQAARGRHATKARALRRRLEAFHGRPDPRALDAAWPHLNSPDPWLRHAARVAVEHQPVQSWQARALTEERPLAAVTALMALARGGDENTAAQAASRLGAFPFARLSPTEKRIALRVYALCLSRSGDRNDRVAASIRRRLGSFYPNASAALNRTLSAILLPLEVPDGVSRTLPLLSAAGTQEDRLHYLLALRDVGNGWTRDGRDAYFQWLPDAERFIGGEGMPTFVRRIRADALAALPASERSRITATLDADRQRSSAGSLTAPARPFVQAWTVDDLAALLADGDGPDDVGRGKALYAAALCAQCHRLGAEGVAIGPDLTSVASRFSRRDLLESILTPSKVVAEPYRNDVVVTTDGLVVVGRVVPRRDYRASILQIAANPLAPEQITEIHKRRIESHTKSPTSPMPERLLDTLSQAEIRDLLAYLESGGR